MSNKTDETHGRADHKQYGSMAALAQVGVRHLLKRPSIETEKFAVFSVFLAGSILATIAQSFLLINLGMELTVPTIVIREVFQNSKSEFSLTSTEISWYGSILFIFHPIGSFLSGFLQERFGRKRCMVFANVPSIAGWLLLYCTDTVALLYTSTVLMGLSIGFSEAPILSYVGEITEPRLRGSLASLACTGGMLGSLIVFVLGYYCPDWRTVALLSTLCPLTCVCLVLLIPESPVWLVGKGKTEKSIKALCWLRGWTKAETIKAEHTELVRYNEVSGQHRREGDGDKVNAGGTGLISRLEEFKNPAVYRPLRLVMILFLVTNLISLSPCKPFIGKIMTELGILQEQSLLLVCSGVLQYVGCLMVMFSVWYLGKRTLSLMLFSINTALTLILGIYVIVLKSGCCIVSTPWIPVALYCGISFFGAPVISLPWMLISEIFPNKSRGLASGTCAGLGYILMFVLTKSYLPVESILSLGYTMIAFGVIGVLGLAIVFLSLPETENKTLLEIEDFFLKNKSVDL